jgi:uncharacterized OsmC-like protein/alpha-beta hydrolase superfamily lysophospholipase
VAEDRAGVRRDRFRFAGALGDELDARLDLPSADPLAVALVVPCFTCVKNSLAAARVAKGLVARGIGVLRFDFTGLGESKGQFAETTFSSNVEEVVLAAAELRGRQAAPLVLIGHSLGGAAVLAAAAQISEVAAVATINAPFEPAHVLTHLPEAVAELERDREAEVEIGGRSLTIGPRFLDDARSYDLTDAIGSLGRPLFVFHAPTDQLVGLDHPRRIYEAARQPKNFIALDGADHVLSGAADAAYVADVLAAWVSRYVAAAGHREEEGDGRREGVVDVQEVSPDGLAQEIRIGPHRLRSDEPVGAGDDTGPTPYELLLAALGSCTSMTLRMYADRKEWPLEGVLVRVSHQRVHAEDCEECEAESGMVDRIERVLELAGPLSDEQRQRLVEIADKCPVHKTLLGDPHIETRLAGGTEDG